MIALGPNGKNMEVPGLVAIEVRLIQVAVICGHTEEMLCEGFSHNFCTLLFKWAYIQARRWDGLVNAQFE